MNFPHEIQSALLFDRPPTHLETVMRSFLNIEAAKGSLPYNIVEANPGVFYRLFGGGELMITLEYVAGPANAEVFKQSLASAITRIYCPDIAERLMRHRAHILIGVSHGALGSSPEIDRMLDTIGYARPGSNLPQFLRRLEACALLSRIAQDEVPASVVHWTQSNQLIPGEKFDSFAEMAPPSLLHIHPYLFGGGESADGKTLAGIRTFGARHFVDREILIEPSELPWGANLETILAFLRVATTANGYVIPDGDSFGPEDHSESHRVHYRDAEPGDVALYEIEPLLHREFGYQSPNYVPRDRIFDDRAPPLDLMPPASDARRDLLDEWRSKRAMAESVGGSFEVRARPPAPASPPPRPGFGNRPVFGRKAG